MRKTVFLALALTLTLTACHRRIDWHQGLNAAQTDINPAVVNEWKAKCSAAPAAAQINKTDPYCEALFHINAWEEQKMLNTRYLP